MTIVEQIHQEFFTASDKIKEFAIPDKARKLVELGFTSSIEAKDYDPEKEKLMDLVIHYQMQYPNNKFITDSEVERICKKYNLICGPVSAYTGKVPDDKLRQIASFNLRTHDTRNPEYDYIVTYHKKGWADDQWLPKNSKWHKVLPKRIKSDVPLTTFSAEKMLNNQYNTGHRWLVDKLDEEITWFNGLFICAPENEMKTEGLEKKGFFAMFKQKRVIKDPVVLHPCKGGFLILAAWGDEASDENVVNPKMN